MVRAAPERLTVMASIHEKTLPRNTRTRLQHLLDEGDERFFATHPSETERRRFYFCGERVLGGGNTSRYVVASRDADGGLQRRFEQEGGGE